MKSNRNKFILSKIFIKFLKDESIGGKLIIIAAVLGLFITNSKYKIIYDSLINKSLNLQVHQLYFHLSLKQAISEGLMTLFFLLVGIEIKREFTKGELKKTRTAILPVAAAIGGMLMPALIYSLLNMNRSGMKGWGIPMATDTAIAIGMLMLLGKRIPAKLKVFLMSLAIVDDMGAIIVIAIFYNQNIRIPTLIISGIIFSIIYILAKTRRLPIYIFSILSILLWLTVFLSGISPSILGVILGLLATNSYSLKNRKSFSIRLEAQLLPLVTFFIVPLFVFTNAGLTFRLDVFNYIDNIFIALGIMFGLVIGKVSGVVIGSWLVIKLRLSSLPSNITWSQFIGIGFLAGIGFTISIFITNIAFGTNKDLVDSAKIGIFIGSIVSGLLGIYTLKSISKNGIKD